MSDFDDNLEAGKAHEAAVVKDLTDNGWLAGWCDSFSTSFRMALLRKKEPLPLRCMPEIWAERYVLGEGGLYFIDAKYSRVQDSNYWACATDVLEAHEFFKPLLGGRVYYVFPDMTACTDEAFYKTDKQGINRRTGNPFQFVEKYMCRPWQEVLGT